MLYILKLDMNTKYKILIVDDEADIVEFLSYNLKKEGFEVSQANNGITALKIAEEKCPNLILLDIMMPGMDGIETCENIRAIPSLSNTIVAFLTARAEDFSQIAGFSVGADDYITKPVKPKILISRIHALLKRSSATNTQKKTGDRQTTFGSLLIDKERHVIIVNSVEYEMPRKEFKLLLFLSSRPSKLFTREEIFQHLWGPDVIVNDRTIDVYIRKLREKMGEEHIKTVKGIGYKFEP